MDGIIWKDEKNNWEIALFYNSHQFHDEICFRSGSKATYGDVVGLHILSTRVEIDYTGNDWGLHELIFYCGSEEVAHVLLTV